MARGRKPKPRGLGDTIEKITEATGLKKLVHFIAGQDCGCEERKELLNKAFPYKKVECLTETEYQYLSSFFEGEHQSIRPSVQIELLKISNRIFNITQDATNCADCWRKIISDLRTLFENYGEEFGRKAQQDPISGTHVDVVPGIQEEGKK